MYLHHNVYYHYSYIINNRSTALLENYNFLFLRKSTIILNRSTKVNLSREYVLGRIVLYSIPVR